MKDGNKQILSDLKDQLMSPLALEGLKELNELLEFKRVFMMVLEIIENIERPSNKLISELSKLIEKKTWFL